MLDSTDELRKIRRKIESESYAPWTWRTHPLHLVPPMPYAPDDQRTRDVLNWIFVVSSLNFSFWSEREGYSDRYGVEWRTSWGSEQRKVWTGYWSLLASLNKGAYRLAPLTCLLTMVLLSLALESGIPFTDPTFYSSEDRCPDELITEIFKPAPQCIEEMPLLKERIRILRENGKILCDVSS